MRSRIRHLRKQLNLSQQEFSEKIHISRSQLSYYESGTVNIPERSQNEICEKFGVNIEWLRTGEGEVYKPTPTLNELINLIDNFPIAKEDEFKIKTVKALFELDNSEWEVIAKLANKVSKDM